MHRAFSLCRENALFPLLKHGNHETTATRISARHIIPFFACDFCKQPKQLYSKAEYLIQPNKHK